MRMFGRLPSRCVDAVGPAAQYRVHVQDIGAHGYRVRRMWRPAIWRGRTMAVLARPVDRA